MEAFGDISAALTVTYTVSGTATSGTDFTALSGSVTFAAKSDHTDVTVTLSGDSSAEDTETVTVTIAEDEDYLLGNDSDSLFVRDDDTRRIVWAGRVDGNWRNPLNWETFIVPTSSDEVYFNGSVSNVSCTNFGEGWWVNGVPVVNPLTSVSGLHIVNAYSGAVTLGVALAANTYEQLSGTLNQPSGDHLTITKAMIWTGGTLNGITDSVSNVNIDGAAGRIDPPDSGHMDIASTLRVINSALVTILPGALDFIGGQGMYIDAQVTLRVNYNVGALHGNTGGNGQIVITSDGFYNVVTLDNYQHTGAGTLDLPIANAGTFTLQRGIQLEVKGHAGGGNGPSISQTAGITKFWSGSLLIPKHGMTVSGGNIFVVIVQQNTEATLEGDLSFGGSYVGFSSFGDVSATSGKFKIDGDVGWSSGTYMPKVDGADETKASLWWATGKFTVAEGVSLLADISNQNAAQAFWKWKILEGKSGVTRDPPPLQAGLPLFDTAGESQNPAKWWNIRRKAN